MSVLKFANDAATTLAIALGSAGTTATLAAGTGARFPSLGAGEVFKATLVDAATGNIKEIVLVTARVTDVCTIVRAQEGTTAQNWAVGDAFINEWTAGSAATYLQQGQTQAQGENYAADAGSANVYSATYTPAITAHVAGMPLRVKIANTNTGASTFDPGPDAVSIVHPNGNASAAGDIVAGAIYEMIYDGTHYQINTPAIVVGDSGSGGKEGLVPAPGSGDAALLKALLASGAFGYPLPGVQSLGSSGHINIGTLIIQWGQTSCNADGAQATVTWPIAFPTAPYWAICSQNTNTTTSIERSGCAIYSLTTTQATINNNASITTNVGWIVVGH